MKSNVRLFLRLALHVILSHLLLVAAIITVIATAETIVPEPGDHQDSIGLYGMLVIILSFVVLFGWSIGWPIFHMMSWINRLANGIYDEPDQHKKLYTRRRGKLKLRYRLFKELIIHLQTLSEQLEKSKQERRRLDERKREWIAGVSHDLKTPLTYIKGYSTMLLTSNYDWDTEERTKFLTEIQSKADHMEELIGDLNASFQLEEGSIPLKLTKSDLVECVRRIVVDVANDPRASHHNLTLESNVTYIHMMLDTKLLGRALLNLLINAIVHNPTGTTINVSIIESNGLQIVISDDGSGMDEEMIDGLFEKYYRGTSTDANSEGTGLGMAIAKQFIIALGGDIVVTSQLNIGTKITVSFPA
ncbi:HAMP domain-containing histidine kinase [Paenibacillus sp. GSMTC-2017]|uniref:sensor histidine kinase n=1 Tax=Paenibacillus sp. GSMTC-2017 TaxID=2794350 RepID=UPI0018D6A4BB|nr:HAMP domain-containing sensor histidine kinase [Paenibacillus sp. GSMTC-2017]MBH5319883.1 HAMP domain-containing histidine kinase [Paenibacillus sp. GSMTC-2017]